MIKLARKTWAPCSKCGSSDHPKYRRKKLRANGKRTISKATYCVVCHYEDMKVHEAKRYNKKLAYNREWKRNNRDKANASARKNYAKSRPYITRAMMDPGRVDWFHTKNSGGFSQMTYTPTIYLGMPASKRKKKD